jgi:hypothetical protein
MLGRGLRGPRLALGLLAVLGLVAVDLARRLLGR